MNQRNTLSPLKTVIQRKGVIKIKTLTSLKQIKTEFVKL